MIKIDDYKFGVITINSKDYKEDVIITINGDIAKRKTELSKNNHEFSKKEIADVLKQDPEVLVIGTGKSGVAEVKPEAEKLCKEKNVKLEAKPTSQAIGRFNWHQGKHKVAAIFHLTC